MMGLLTGYQDDAERLARQDKNLMRNYTHDVRGLKAEAAPHEATVKDYNTQVKGFKNSAVYGMVGGNEELWHIGGWLTANPGYIRAVSQEAYNPNSGSKWQPAGANLYHSSYSSNNGGGWYWTDSNTATIRNAADGTPIAQMAHNTPGSFYASWNDRPFVAPLTQSQTDTAKASDDVLKGIGGRSDAMKSEFDASQGLLSKKADRLEGDVSMNQGALAADMQPEAGASVFDQTKVFQSITDWLKG